MLKLLITIIGIGLSAPSCLAQQGEAKKVKGEEALVKDGVLAVGDIPLVEVFRKLANEAGIKLYISDAVVQELRGKSPGISFEGLTALDALRVIATSLNLDLKKIADGHYLRTYKEVHALDDVIGPQRAARIAAYRRSLYEAFRREGFNKEQSIRLALSETVPPPRP